MVAYPKFLSKIISLLEAGISAYRIEMFIGGADEKLFARSYEELEAALKTEAISDRYELYICNIIFPVICPKKSAIY